MILSKMTPCQKIEIKQRRFRDNHVLIAKWKVGTHNEVTFEEKSRPDVYYLSGKTIQKYPIEMVKNKAGKLNPFYAVNMDELVILERE